MIARRLAGFALGVAVAWGGAALLTSTDTAQAQLGPVPGDGGIRRGPQGSSSQTEEVRRRFEELRRQERQRQGQGQSGEALAPPQTTLEQDLGAVLREDGAPVEGEQGQAGVIETRPTPPAPAPSREETEAVLGATTPPAPTGPEAGGLREGDPLLTARRDLGDRIETTPTTVGAGAVLRGLDKFTGERVTLTLALDESGAFQRMRVEIRACYARVSARDSEATAFVQIYDEGQEPPLEIFSGWMFSTSPALSAVDHPRFDFWVLSCTTS